MMEFINAVQATFSIELLALKNIPDEEKSAVSKLVVINQDAKTGIWI